MLTKSVKSVISVALKHVARAKKSVLSVRSVSDSNILLSGNKDHEVLFIKSLRRKKLRFGVLADSNCVTGGSASSHNFNSALRT